MNLSKILTLRIIEELARITAPIGKQINSIPVIWEGSDEYDDLPEPDKAEPMAAIRVVRDALSGPITSFRIVGSDKLFSLQSVSFLTQKGWTEKDVAIFSFLHELAHLATWGRNAEDIKNDSLGVGAWTGAFASWPLKKTSQLMGPIAFKLKCSYIADASPTGKFAPAIGFTQKAEEVVWATNLAELRADALAVAWCQSSTASLLSNHPLKKDFKTALDQLKKSRDITAQTNPAYRWGHLSDFLRLLPKLHEKDAAGPVAWAEQSAWACANENWPVFFNATGAQANFYTTILPYIPNTAAKDAATQTEEALKETRVLIKKYAEKKDQNLIQKALAALKGPHPQ